MQWDGRELGPNAPLQTLLAMASVHAYYFGLLGWIIFLLQQVVTYFVVFQRPRSAAARLLLVFNVLLSSVSLTTCPAHLLHRAAYWPTELYVDLQWARLAGPVVAHLLLTFPVEKGILRCHPRHVLGAPLLTFGVALLQWLLRPLTGWDSAAAVVAASLGIAPFSQPLLRRIRRIIDRRFYRRKYDAPRMLQVYGARLRDEVELDSLSADLRSVVCDTVRPAHGGSRRRPRSGKGPVQ